MRAEPPQNVAGLVRAERGQVVLLALYASSCKDCRAELPVLDALEGRYRAKGLAVVAISVDDDPGDVAEMLRDMPLRSLPLVRLSPLEPSVVSASMRTLGATWTGPIPYVALFDRSGRLVREWREAGAMLQLDRAISPLL